jgi:hypothetical protein
MSFDTFENLKKEIIDWSHRRDLDLKIDGFIQLAENKMRDNEIENLKLRAFDTNATDTLLTTSRFIPLPTGYQDMRTIKLLEGTDLVGQLKYLTPTKLNPIEETGIPCFFTVTDQIELNVIPDQAYTIEFQYMADFVPLSTAAPVNSILTENPLIYLFGALWALREHTQEQAEADRMYARFIQAIQGANKGNREGNYGPNPTIATDGMIV